MSRRRPKSRTPTSHEKISRIISPAFEFEKLDPEIRALTRLAVEMDYPGIVRKLKQIVPEYQPQHELDYLRLWDGEPLRGGKTCRVDLTSSGGRMRTRGRPRTPVKSGVSTARGCRSSWRGERRC